MGIATKTASAMTDCSVNLFDVGQVNQASELLSIVALTGGLWKPEVK